MRTDGTVSRRKYERELQRLRSQAGELASHGIWVVGESVYPVIEAVFVPRAPLTVAIPAQVFPQLLVPRGTVAQVEVPSLAARAFKVRLDLSNFDLRAPSVEFRDAFHDRPLGYTTMLRAFEYEEKRGAHMVLLPDHPTFHRPFLCLRGIREYHEHPQHSGDDWMLYRPHTSAFAVLMSVWRTTVDLVKPLLVVDPAQSQLQVQWAVENKR